MRALKLPIGVDVGGNDAKQRIAFSFIKTDEFTELRQVLFGIRCDPMTDHTCTQRSILRNQLDKGKSLSQPVVRVLPCNFGYS
jgi:hypothetical protein